jgi:hypothetical protein
MRPRAFSSLVSSRRLDVQSDAGTNFSSLLPRSVHMSRSCPCNFHCSVSAMVGVWCSLRKTRIAKSEKSYADRTVRSAIHLITAAGYHHGTSDSPPPPSYPRIAIRAAPTIGASFPRLLNATSGHLTRRRFEFRKLLTCSRSF